MSTLVVISYWSRNPNYDEERLRQRMHMTMAAEIHN